MSDSRNDSNSNTNRNWTLGIVSVALFMAVLDNLVVSVALPTIHRDLGASIQSLEWTVNAYVLAYAVLLLTGAALLAGFVARERRTSEPMLPMSFFATRSFAVTNVVSLSMYFGMFGSIFFLSQYMQNVLGNTPLQAGLKLLVWTGASMVPAMWVGVAVLGAGALTVLALPFRTSAAADATITDVEVADVAGADVAGGVPVAVAAAGVPAPADGVLALAAGEAV